MPGPLFTEYSVSLGASAAAGRFLLLRLFAGFLDQRLAREADLVALDGEHLDQYLVAQLEFVTHVADTVLGDFADVQQSVGTREELHECAELSQANHFAEV